MSRRWMAVAIAVTSAAVAGPVTAQETEPAYRDDRSTPTAVISSYYNAITRAEYARAYSYFGAEEAPADYDRWQAGYSDTERVDVDFGETVSEGAAGSIYYSVPVRLTVQETGGRRSYITGCYVLRRAQPAVQSPPFRPMHIESASLHEANAADAPPEHCD